MESVKNTLKNSVAPIYRSMDSATGFLLDVVLEVTFTWVIRYLIGLKVTLMELFFTTVLAAPLISTGSFIGTGNDGAQAWSTRFLVGLQGVPSYFVAQYIIQTTQKGFYVPKINLWSILITTIARLGSRVVIMTLVDNVNLPGKDKWNEYNTFTQNAVAAGRFA